MDNAFSFRTSGISTSLSSTVPVFPNNFEVEVLGLIESSRDRAFVYIDLELEGASLG